MSKAKKIVVVFLSILTISSLILAVPVSAETGTVYTIASQQPQASNYDGYMEVLLYNPSNGVYQVYTYYWTIAGYSYNTSDVVVFPKMYLKVSSSSITFEYFFTSTSSSNKFYFTLLTGYVRSGDSAYKYNYNGSGESNAVSGSFWVAPWLEIVGVKVYGNGVLKSNSTDIYNGGSWSVVYGGDNALYSELEQIKSILSQQNNNDIIANADKNASETQSNDNKNTQAIIDNQNDLAEKEKTETQNQGEGSVNDVSGAIEDKSAGFVSSIGNLVSAMSYNGTSCAWKFPALKLPAIAGVMSEIKLTDEKPIDFEFWVNKMPSNVLLLVRSLLTIALIVYCFKELYNTISYVLTLKGGGNSE